MTLAWPLIIILCIGVVVSYLGGVRKGKAWGKIAAALCAVGVLAVAGVKVMNRGPAGEVTTGRSLTEVEYERAKAIGAGLKGIVEPGCRIFILSSYGPMGGPGIDQAKDSWNRGLSDGLGDSTFRVVGYYGPAPGTAESLSQGILQAEEQIDVLVSFQGLPQGLLDMSIYAEAEPPRVAAYFHGSPDMAPIRRWLNDGLLDVAVVEQNGVLTTHTPDGSP